MSKYLAGRRLTPLDQGGYVRTGFGIILRVLPLPEYWPEDALPDGAERVLYEVVTDFGNTMKMTILELERSYWVGEVEDIKERLEIIISNHQEVLRDLNQ